MYHLIVKILFMTMTHSVISIYIKQHGPYIYSIYYRLSTFNIKIQYYKDRETAALTFGKSLSLLSDIGFDLLYYGPAADWTLGE